MWAFLHLWEATDSSKTRLPRRSGRCSPRRGSWPRSRSSPRSAAGSQSPQPRLCSSGRSPLSRSGSGRRSRSARGVSPPCTSMCATLFFCPFSGGALIPLLRSPSSASDGPSGEAAGMEANKRRLTLDLTSTLQRWLKVWRSRASACAGAVKSPSTGRPTKGEADTLLLGGAMRHSQHALGAPSGRYAVRPGLRARGFSRRAGHQGQRRSTGLPGCSARTRSTRCRRGPALSGWRGCPAPAASPRSRRCLRATAL